MSVTGVGTAVVDYIGVVEHYPGPDTQIELQTFSKQPGGNVATAMVTLARLGADATFLGKFGDDELGRLVQAGLTENGVDLTRSLIEAGGSMGFAFIIVEAGSGRRTILWTGEGKSHLAADEVNREAILASRYLHLDHYSIDAAIAAAQIAREGGVQVVLDAEAQHPGIDKLLPLVDVLIACADFACDYTGSSNCEEALAKLFDTTAAHTVAITAGEQGSYCKTAAETHWQPAFPVEVVDTTGCGDVYHGAFIYGLLQEWPVARIAEFASAAAALNCLGLGGQSAIPDLAEVEAFLASSKQKHQQ
ncbi:hypothetical protein AB833_22155 [Chromatiales bacterium (ex Bugula neritina AB1)]|nr:hypothetical protein AB833_22155 [Chromatiales bacterium (ex Bugula neritina AB1)]